MYYVTYVDQDQNYVHYHLKYKNAVVLEMPLKYSV